MERIERADRAFNSSLRALRKIEKLKKKGVDDYAKFVNFFNILFCCCRIIQNSSFSPLILTKKWKRFVFTLHSLVRKGENGRFFWGHFKEIMRNFFAIRTFHTNYVFNSSLLTEKKSEFPSSSLMYDSGKVELLSTPNEDLDEVKLPPVPSSSPMPDDFEESFSPIHAFSTMKTNDIRRFFDELSDDISEQNSRNLSSLFD